jgi:hypothetical protein
MTVRADAALFGLFLSFLARTSLGADTESPVAPEVGGASGLEFQAPASCPDRAAFVHAVETLTDRWRESASPSRTFIVTLRDVDQTGEAEALVVVRSDKVGAPRVLRTASCEEAARAAAFVVALTIDPEVSTQPESASEPRSARPPPRSGVREPRGRSLVRMFTSASAEALGLSAPGVVWGVGGSVGARIGSSVDVRLGFVQTIPSTVDVGATQTSLVWTIARLESCVVAARATHIEMGVDAVVSLRSRFTVVVGACGIGRDAGRRLFRRAARERAFRAWSSGPRRTHRRRAFHTECPSRARCAAERCDRGVKCECAPLQCARCACVKR